MNKVFWLAALGVVALAGWKIGDALSPDAIALALGMIFGVMAGIPIALIAMTADRKVVHVHRIEQEHPETAHRAHLGPGAVTLAIMAENARQRPALPVSDEIRGAQ